MTKKLKILLINFFAFSLSSCATNYYIAPTDENTATLFFPVAEKSRKLLGGVSTSGVVVSRSDQNGCGKFVPPPKGANSIKIPSGVDFFIKSYTNHFGSKKNTWCHAQVWFHPEPSKDYLIHPITLPGKCAVQIFEIIGDEKREIQINRAYTEPKVGLDVCKTDVW